MTPPWGRPRPLFDRELDLVFPSEAGTIMHESNLGA